MFCSKCGTQLGTNLSYCNRCGFKVKSDKKDEMMEFLGFGSEETGESKVSPLNGAITSLTFLGLGGLGILVGLIAILLDKEVSHNAIFAISIVYLAALFGICFLLIKQISKLVDFSIESRKSENQSQFSQSQPAAQPAYIAPPTTPQLNQMRESVHSVTEHTTKSLEETPVARNS